MDYSKYKGGGNYVYLPKIGNQAIFEIESIGFGRAENNKYNFSKKVIVDLPDGSKAEKSEPIRDENGDPFNLRVVLKDGKILTTGSWGAFQEVFVKNDVQEGDKIRVGHLGRGEWIVEKNDKITNTKIEPKKDDEEDVPF